MKQYILFYLSCVLGLTLAGNVTNKTTSVNNDLSVDGDEESIYTVDVLLVADDALTGKVDQNDTGLSIRLTARDNTVSAWYQLYASEESNYFGQRNYILSGNARDLGVISSISLRIDKPELAASAMPYYLCIHGTTNNITSNINWNGCAYIQLTIGDKNEREEEYFLRDADGNLI